MMTGKLRNNWAFGMDQKEDGDSFESLLREMCEGGTMSDEEGHSYCTHCYESDGHTDDCALNRAKKMLHV